MSAQHTPGPWVAVGCQVEVLSDSIPDICSTNPETFGQHGRSNKERCANARLISAAPDLLAMAKAYIQAFEIGMITNQTSFGVDTTGHIAEKAYAAIAKNDGQVT